MPPSESREVIRGPEATGRAGRELARRLEPGDVVLFRGEVGAGKSTMIRSLLRALGVSGPIPSPTFTIARSYIASLPDGTDRERPVVVSHLDLHRIARIEDEDPGLLAEHFGPDRIALVEWPEGKEDFLVASANRILEVRIEHRDEDSRFLTTPVETPEN